MKLSITCLIFFLFSTSLFSQQFLGDLNPRGSEEQSSPQDLVPFKNGFLFIASTQEEGQELWWTNGSPTGAKLLKDIYPGPKRGSSAFSIASSVMIEDTLFFYANDGTYTSQIWRTDGTSAGTYLLGNFEQPISPLVTYQGELYFTVVQEAYNLVDLWKGSGQVNDFQIVKEDIPSLSFLEGMYVANNLLFFSAFTDTDVFLWRTDGTTQGTFSILTGIDGIGAGGTTDEYSHYIEFQNKLFFIGRDNGVPYLYESDGTANGTQSVTSITPGLGTLINRGEALLVNGEMYFSFDKINPPYTFSLYKSDGTQAGTQEVLNLSGLNRYGNSNVLISGDWIYLTAPDSLGTQFGRFNTQLSTWESIQHLTALDNLNFLSGTIEIAENTSSLKTIYIPAQFATSGTINSQIWRTDGSPGGTFDLQAGALTTRQVAVENDFYFGASGSNNDSELYISDGTVSGTTLLQNIEQNINSVEYSPASIVYQNQAYIYLNDGVHDGELWQTDGTVSGTTLFKDIHPGGGSSVTDMAVFKGLLFFSADNGIVQELWVSNGTQAGTQLLKDLIPTAIDTSFTSSFPSKFTEFGDYLYFTAHQSTELWRTDGTSAGTELVLIPGKNSFNQNYVIRDLELANGELFFSTFRGGRALWKTDGTIGDTTRIIDGLDTRSDLVEFNGEVYFNAYQNLEFEVWKSDGTPTGTSLIKNVTPNIGRTRDIIPSPIGLTSGVNELYFFQDDHTHGRELWKTDGTFSGTVLVRDIYPGASSALHNRIAKAGSMMNGYYFFAAWDGVHGVELWKSNGSSQGTQMVLDLNPGPGSSFPDRLFSTDSLLFFAAYNESTGMELWQTDGTPAGTKQLTDINPGPANANPEPILMLGSTLIFSALDGTHGRELWSLNLLTSNSHSLNIDPSFHLFPNPSADIINIQWDTPFIKDAKVALLTIEGKVVSEYEIPANPSSQEISIAIDMLPSGIYLVKFKDSTQSIIRKFVKM